MKKRVIAAAMALVLTISAYGQGQVNFNNKVSASGIDAPAKSPSGEKATSPPYAAALAVDSGGTLTYIPASATTFRPGVAAGYIMPLVVTVPGHDISSSVTLRMFGYAGAATDAAASGALAAGAFGTWNPVTVTLGGGTILPPDMIGLSNTVVVPEPSTIALALVGAAALLISRRKQTILNE
jgi:hypothetical protein